MSFSSEIDDDNPDNLFLTVLADLRDRDMERNAPTWNPGGPLISVYVFLLESGDLSKDGFTAISKTRLVVKAFDGDYGEDVEDLDEALMRMSLASSLTKKEYKDICDRVRLLPSARKQLIPAEPVTPDMPGETPAKRKETGRAASGDDEPECTKIVIFVVESWFLDSLAFTPSLIRRANSPGSQ